MDKDKYIDTLERALIDVLDGNQQPHEIVCQTGLSLRQATALSNLFSDVLKRQIEKHPELYF